MEKIEIISYNFPIVSLYNPEDKLVGNFKNDIELNLVQVQIALKKATGYYIRFEDKIIPINEKGELADWPRNMYDMTQKTFADLIHIRRGEEPMLNYPQREQILKK